MLLRKLFLLLALSIGCINAQVESMKINNEFFLKPSVNTLGFLMTNVDSVVWNDNLLPLKIPSLPSGAKVTALEYKKVFKGMSQYINFDDRFWVLTIIWKDESGKNLITKGLKKELKKHEYNTTGYYKIDYKGTSLIISIDSNKEKSINEMITVEIERK